MSTYWGDPVYEVSYPLLRKLRDLPCYRDVSQLTNGIFHYIDYDNFEEIGYSADELELEFRSKCGFRRIAPIVSEVHDTSEEVEEETFPAKLSDSELTTLGNLILKKYSRKWDRLYDVYSRDYEQLFAYYDEFAWGSVDSHDESSTTDSTTTRTPDLSEVRTDALSQLRTDNLTQSTDHGKTTTTTNNLTETDTKNLTDTDNITSENTDTGVYGFNSEDAMPSDEIDHTKTESMTHTGTDTVTNTGTQSVAESGDTEVSNTGTQTTANTGTQTKRYTGDEETVLDGESTKQYTDTSEWASIHQGNIGNMKPAEILQSEIDFWRWNYIETVLNDVKDFMTIPVYE